MAANIFRVNLCGIRSGDGSTGLSTTGNGTNSTGSVSIAPITLTSELRILDSDQKCSVATPVTTFPDPKDTSYAFYGRTETSGGPFEYAWDFVRVQDGTRLSASGACLPNFDLGKDGTWLARLTVTDTVTKAVSQSVATVEIQGDAKRPPTAFTSLSLEIRTDKLTGEAPSNVQFTSVLQGGTGPFTYRWDFADGSFSTDANPQHLFDIPGVRDVQLTVRDSKGATAVASVVLAFTESDDWDKDGVKNTTDACPLVFGPASNQGCPIVVPYTGTSTSTGSAYVPDLTLTLA